MTSRARFLGYEIHHIIPQEIANANDNTLEADAKALLGSIGFEIEALEEMFDD